MSYTFKVFYLQVGIFFPRITQSTCQGLCVSVTLLVAPQTEGCFEGSVAEFAHVLPLEGEHRERWRMEKECI